MARAKSFALPLLIGLTLAGFGLFDFTAFCARAAALSPPATPNADAVVALTGGSGVRIAAGVALVEAGAAPLMLITGINPEVTNADIAKLGGGPPALYECCISFDRKAKTTLGNGKETARWATAGGHKRLIIVTSNYHMPRSLIVLSRAMPELDLIAYPVQSSLDPATPFESLRSIKGLGREWAKWRITRLFSGNVDITPK